MEYDHINFKPPKSVADDASRGLDYRQKAKDKGGLTPEEASKEGVGPWEDKGNVAWLLWEVTTEKQSERSNGCRR